MVATTPPGGFVATSAWPIIIWPIHPRRGNRPPKAESISVQPSILSYLATIHRANPDAEVSGPELQQALGLDAATVKAQIAELVRQGLVEWDPLLSNIWVRITDKGLEDC